LPSRESITKLVEHFNYPVAFDTTRNLKISFQISENRKISKEKFIKKSLDILNYIIENQT